MNQKESQLISAWLIRVKRFTTVVLPFCLILVLSQCGTDPLDDPILPNPPYVADTITDVPTNSCLASGLTESNAVNGVRGGGEFDVASVDVWCLGFAPPNNYLTLEWSGVKVINGAGIDFVVFENPIYFGTADPANLFPEPTIVEVSVDNTNWCGFAPDYLNTDENTFDSDPTLWQNFAGITPVKYNVDTNNLATSDLFDPILAGGDGFDLDNLSSSNADNIGCSLTLQNQIITNGFLYIRLTPQTERTNPDTGNPFVNYSWASVDFLDGPDIDGVVAKYISTRN